MASPRVQLIKARPLFYPTPSTIHQMKTIITSTLIIAMAASLSTGCRSTSEVSPESSSVIIGRTVPTPVENRDEPRASFMPKAIIYKTSGDYNNNVPISLNATRTEIISYPSPSDLTDSSTPVPLADGWLLDRRGVSASTAFTTYTYADYAAMPAPPSTADLLRAVIPGARVTEIRRLPYPVGTATDISAINRLITDSLATLPLVYTAPVIK